jgi:hypothetical protein
MAGNVLSLAGSVGKTNTLCLSASRMVPNALVDEGTKYQPDNTAAGGTDFYLGDDVSGWKCLGFGVDQPIYFSYAYNADPAGDTWFTTSAQSKLGGVVKQIFQTGIVNSGQLVISPSLCDVEVALGSEEASPGIIDALGDCVAD